MSSTVPLELLMAALEPIAKVTGGYAGIVDAEGKRIKTVDSYGREIKELEGADYPEALEALQKGAPSIGPCPLQKGAQAWYLPVGDCVLVASNLERIREEERLKEEFRKALPTIAAVVGGEATLFDQNGVRLAGFGPTGRVTQGIGTYCESTHKVMRARRPIAGPSGLVQGALAIGFPVGQTFGFSINNEWTVRQNRKLLEDQKSCQYARYTFDHIVGESEAIRRCKAQANRVAATDSTVLLQGESGTGKELFAQAIHNASPRRGRPFIAVNCGAIPPTLAESYLFGYERGSFTGAKREGQEGIFEQANGGTLFLDEVSEMQFDLQAKLLRVLEEREVVRVGGKRVIPVDVRIIASTNKDLAALAARGEFRQDLYYRLSVIEISLPPLRERREDILALVHCFLERLNPIMGTNVKGVSEEALACLMAYQWPGNVRELRNCIERALSIAQGEYITLAELPPLVRDHAGKGATGGSVDNDAVAPREALRSESVWPSEGRGSNEAGQGAVASLAGALKSTEKELIRRVLEECGNNRKKAAERMGISTSTLWRKMRRYGLLQ